LIFSFSHKPNPAIFADDRNPEQARRNLVEALEKMRGRPFEVIMKDISTVQDGPQRLWEWTDIAMEAVAQFPEIKQG